MPRLKSNGSPKSCGDFNPHWDDDLYRGYMKRFSLDENKKVAELSSGMRVKYSLTLALSHRARLLILDEPTSGLDPVARDNLLELFQELIEDGKRSILFSTHITSDLEKCADYITYIENGCIIESRTKDDLIAAYRLVKGTQDQLQGQASSLIAYKVNAFGVHRSYQDCRSGRGWRPHGGVPNTRGDHDLSRQKGG